MHGMPPVHKGADDIGDFASRRRQACAFRPMPFDDSVIIAIVHVRPPVGWVAHPSWMYDASGGWFLSFGN
jgi:hypothetical protein